MQNNQSKAIADGTRRKILDLLTERTHTAGELAEICQTTPANLSQHMKVLKEAGLVRDEKKGLYVHYSLATPYKPHLEVKALINLKDRILQQLQDMAHNKKCEAVLGTDSHDDGTLFVMRGNTTFLAFDYSFRLHSFKISFTHPSSIPNLDIPYEEEEKIHTFYRMVEREIDQAVQEIQLSQEEKHKQKEKIQGELKHYLNRNANVWSYFMSNKQEAIQELHSHCDAYFKQNSHDIPNVLKQKMIEEVMLEWTTLGRIHPLMEDSSISEIMINGPQNIWVERGGKLQKTDIVYRDQEELMSLVNKIYAFHGRHIHPGFPFLNAHLPDGSHAHIISERGSKDGILITIRKFLHEKLTMNDFIAFGTLTEQMAGFLKAAVQAKSNLIITGGNGSGKTNLLNILGNEIPNDERIITIEEREELHLNRDHVVRLGTRPANSEGHGEITQDMQVFAARHMRPERIIVSELTGKETFSLLDLMQHGQNGHMATTTSVSAESCVQKMSTMILQKGWDLPDRYSYQLIAGSVDIIVQLTRIKDGSRKCTGIYALNKQVDRVHLLPLFQWKTEGKRDEAGNFLGTFQACADNIPDQLREQFDQCDIDIQSFFH